MAQHLASRERQPLSGYHSACAALSTRVDAGNRQALLQIKINHQFDRWLDSPDALLGRYLRLIGWSEAVATERARMAVLQRFARTATVSRSGIDYRLCASTNLYVSLAGRSADVIHVNGLTV